MYRATEHLPSESDTSADGVDWYVRKFRLESDEGGARLATPLEVPEVRSRKWLLGIFGAVLALSALLALATFATAP
jgi:hypothetical protein